VLVTLVPFSVVLALEASVDPVVVVPVVPVVEELLIVDDMPSSKSGEQRSPAAVDMVDIVEEPVPMLLVELLPVPMLLVELLLVPMLLVEEEDPAPEDDELVVAPVVVETDAELASDVAADTEVVPILLVDPVPVLSVDPVSMLLDDPVPILLDDLVPMLLEDPVPILLEDPVPILLEAPVPMLIVDEA